MWGGVTRGNLEIRKKFTESVVGFLAGFSLDILFHLTYFNYIAVSSLPNAMLRLFSLFLLYHFPYSESALSRKLSLGILFSFCLHFSLIIFRLRLKALFSYTIQKQDSFNVSEVSFVFFENSLFRN